MIVAERKPLQEITALLTGYARILVVGCRTCVTVCWAGGEKEVGLLASQLRLAAQGEERDLSVAEAMVERQCETEMVQELAEAVSKADAVVSMGCGIGAQTMAKVYDTTPVFAALNTVFMGAPEAEGVWTETCMACGDCLLNWTGGICPNSRCAKGLLNGPCGGVRKGGKCEIDPEKDCAWVLIYRKLEKLQRLALMERYYEPRNHRTVKRPGKIVAAGREAP